MTEYRYLSQSEMNDLCDLVLGKTDSMKLEMTKKQSIQEVEYVINDSLLPLVNKRNRIILALAGNKGSMAAEQTRIEGLRQEFLFDRFMIDSFSTALTLLSTVPKLLSTIVGETVEFAAKNKKLVLKGFVKNTAYPLYEPRISYKAVGEGAIRGTLKAAKENPFKVILLLLEFTSDVTSPSFYTEKITRFRHGSTPLEEMESSLKHLEDIRRRTEVVAKRSISEMDERISFVKNKKNDAVRYIQGIKYNK